MADQNAHEWFGISRWQSSWQTTSSSTQAGASRRRQENESVARREHEPQRER